MCHLFVQFPSPVMDIFTLKWHGERNKSKIMWPSGNKCPFYNIFLINIGKLHINWMYSSRNFGLCTDS